MQKIATSEPASRVPLTDQTIHAFLQLLAAKTPTPGGGSLTALTGALAAAQAQMAVAYTLGKRRFAAVEPELRDYSARLDKAMALLEELMEEDRAAYETLHPLLKFPPEKRPAADFAPALLAAIRIPQTVGVLALQVLEICRGLVDKTTPPLLSDLGVAAGLARAAVEACELNVRVNLELLDDQAQAGLMAREAAAHRQAADTLWRDIFQRLIA